VYICTLYNVYELKFFQIFFKKSDRERFLAYKFDDWKKLVIKKIS